MSRQRFFALAIAALVVLAGALWLNARRNATPEFHETALLPTLGSELDTVSLITVSKGAPAPVVTLRKSATGWTVAERGDYPADVSKLHKLLLALGDAKIIDEKTQNPAEFALIGVEDPAQSGATGTLVSVTARDGAHAVIIGKGSGSGDFARRAGENQSYLIQPSISLETEPRFWIDAHLIDIPVADVETMAVKLADGPSYVVKRVKPKESSFTLEGVPAGRKPAESPLLAPSPSMGGVLTADDVAHAKDVDFSKPSEATLTLSGGKVITLHGAVVNDKHWIEIESGADPALTARAQGRIFEIPGYRYEAIFRPIDQLLEPKPTPPPKTAKTGTGAASKAGTESKKPSASLSPAPPPASP